MKSFFKTFFKVLGVLTAIAAAGAAVYYLLKKYGIIGDCDMDCENCDLDCECAGMSEDDEIDDFDEREYVSIQPVASDAEEPAEEPLSDPDPLSEEI